MLAFARRQPLHPRNVDVNGTVLDIAKLLRPTLGEQIEIETVLEQEVATAHIDASQLANSLLNMAINARDAMPDGGKLTARDPQRRARRGLCRRPIPTCGPAPMSCSRSATPAPACPSEVQDKVFEPFFTTKEVGKGSGLGLSMVYGFVKQSGGHIRIYSEEGHGTTIKLYLPPGADRPRRSLPRLRRRPAAARPSWWSKTTRWCATSSPTQLQSLGYKTIDAADGPAALESINSGARSICCSPM